MDCPHCGKAFHEQWVQTYLPHPAQTDVLWFGRIAFCPACNQATVDLKRAPRSGASEDLRVYPNSTFRSPTPKEVPASIRDDYEQACRVLPLSEKASAALARRCLQTILRAQGYAQRDLAAQIDALLGEPDPAKAIPTSLRRTVDAIRNFGNFSAHPVTDLTTLQVIDVEPGEAEWCLDILDDMFDHYYVKPAEVDARKAALNAKLTAAGKPPAK